MLEQLKLMVLATDNIQQHDGGKGKVFGHLIILARDLSGPDKPEQIRELLLDNEVVGSFGDRKGAANRNTLRDDLRSSFESIIVRTLPTPHPDITEERSAAISPSEFTATFKAAVKGLRTDIIEMLKTPHTFGGSPILGGDSMSSVMASLCEAVNDSKNISPPSLLQAIDLRKVQKAAADALALATVRLDDMSEFMVSSKMTSKRIEAATSQALDEFHRAVKSIAHDTVQEEQEKMEKTLAALAAAAVGLQDKKRRDLDHMLANFAKKAMAVVDDQAHRMSVPVSSPAQLKGEFDRVVREAYTAYARSHAGSMPVNRQGDLEGDLPWALTKAEFSNKVKGLFSRLRERNNVAVQLQEYRKDNEAAQRRERLAQQEKERAENAERAAAQRAEEARADAAEARRMSQAQRPFYAAHDILYPSYYWDDPPMPYGGRRGRSRRGVRSRRGGGARFYAGGQFIPGGGHAPPGGVWI